MKHELNENFKMKLQNNEIINFENIISAINAEENIEMLKEYYEILTTKINPYLYKNLDKIINALQLKIEELEKNKNEFNSFIEKIEQTYIEFEEVLPLLYQYTNKNQLTEDEMIKIYAYLSNTITIYEHEFDGSINYREKEVFHYTMNYIETKEKNEIETHLLERYNSLGQGQRINEIDPSISPNSGSVQSGIQSEISSMKAAREAFVEALEGTGEVGRVE